MPYIDKDKLLNSITREDFITILKALGDYKYRKGSDGSVMTTTALCHGGDSAYKVYFYPNSNDESKKGLCVCMTCGDKYDLVQFVIRAHRHINKQLTWHKALQWIAVTLGRLGDVSIEDGATKIQKPDDFSWINRIKAVKNRDEKTKRTRILDENLLELFTYIPHESWLNDGCSISALNRYEIGYSPAENAIVIPHRDINGNLIGIRGRYLSDEDIAKGKYRPITVENRVLKHPLGDHLYGLWVTKDYIQKCGKILLAEGEKSCLQAYSMFSVEEDKSYVVATCGSNISQRQIEIIKSLGVSKVIYAPDKEYKKSDSFEAEAWFNKQILKLEPFLLYCQVYLIADTKDRIGYKDSPFDKGRSTFLELYEEKIEITMDDINRVKQETKKGAK